MGIQKLMDLERELSNSYTESLNVNMDSSNPHRKDAISLVENRRLSLSLRKHMNIN